MKQSLRQSGLTLLEILVAMVVMSIAFVALANSQISNLKVTRDSQAASVATEIAVAKLEELSRSVLVVDDSTSPPKYRFQDYDDCPNSTKVVCNATGEVNASYPGYTTSYTIEGLSGIESEGLLRVEVAVAGTASLSLVSFFSCYDVYPSPSVNKPAPCPEPAHF